MQPLKLIPLPIIMGTKIEDMSRKICGGKGRMESFFWAHPAKIRRDGRHALGPGAA
jgi:hypothetical protein